jgi:hypothetical protein
MVMALVALVYPLLRHQLQQRRLRREGAREAPMP